MTDANKYLSSSLTVRSSSNKFLRSSFTIRKRSSKALSSSFAIQRSSSKALSSSFTTQGVKPLSCSFWIGTGAQYKVERVNNFVTTMAYTPPIIATGANYVTVLEVDTKGYKTFTAIIAAGEPNDVTYRIQGMLSQMPVWAGIPSQVDVEVTSSDAENMGTTATFTGCYDRIRIQVKQKTNPGRALASLKAST
jgi:hypothetical protein